MKKVFLLIGIFFFMCLSAAAQCPPILTVCPNDTISLGESSQLWATGADIYCWTPSNTLSDSSVANPVATPNQTTTYYVTGYNLGGDNLVVNGDFESGNTGFQTDYIYVMGHNMSYGRYAINTDGLNVWNAGGHVYGYGGTGSFMIVDGADHPNATVWSQTVNVQPNTTYAFSAQVVSMLNSYQSGCQALLQFCINGVQVGPVFHAPSTLNTWVQYYEIWNSGNATTATLSILNQNQNGTGNDFGLDDIALTLLDSCSTMDSVCVFVENLQDSVEYTISICDKELPFHWAVADTTFETLPYGLTTFVHQDVNVLGQDSTTIFNLYCYPSYRDTIVANVCSGTPYNDYGFNVSEQETSDEGVIVRTQNLTSQYGCDSVVVLMLNCIDVFVQIDTLNEDFCTDHTMTLKAVSSEDDVLWSTGEVAAQIVVDQVGEYWALVSKEGCVDTAFVTIDHCPCSVELSNVITPNGDGLNDVYAPHVSGDFECVEMWVYDRWGKLVYHTSDSQPQWDAAEVSDGVFFCLVRYSCSLSPKEVRTAHSSVTVIR
ncbi:MAG: gliding motility-associated C-terminal domain-containing protein [Bacteroidales bacterium]|nr:gliding motility-associated C-terminal domain-containing protein [Bacteroidales bacterium]